jgi:KTSC domain
VIVSIETEPDRRLGRCHDMPSTVIADIEYDPERARLTVTFVTGSIYEYVDVPAEVAASFQSAFSKGTFFNGYIRDRYDFRELTLAPATS